MLSFKCEAGRWIKPAYFISTVLFLQFFPLAGKSLLQCAPALPSRERAERVMSRDVAIMFLSSKKVRSGGQFLIS